MIILLYFAVNNPTGFVGATLVHLDLKGAPPKISYYRKVFPLFKTLGASGLLIEYEDMFPYTGSLEDLASGYAYTVVRYFNLSELSVACARIIYYIMFDSLKSHTTVWQFLQ